MDFHETKDDMRGNMQTVKQYQCHFNLTTTAAAEGKSDKKAHNYEVSSLQFSVFFSTDATNLTGPRPSVAGTVQPH
jgi:hypothetical protein